MGGPGSGRLPFKNGKKVTDSYRTLDVRRLHREGLLSPAQSFLWQWSRDGETLASIQVRTEADHVILTYRSRVPGEDWEDHNYPVRLDWTPCHYGGMRPWFHCPGKGCGRRVAILYGGAVFACRHCYHLTYPSQRETPNDRLIRRAEKIRARLGWQPGILNARGWKPKGMHQCTFDRLIWQHDLLVNAAFRDLAKRFNISI